MSIKTWIKEFYSEPHPRGPIEALKHSIKKWEGLRPENLAKHHIKTDDIRDLRDRAGNWFPVDSTSCALCTGYYSADSMCSKCPLTQSLGRACHAGADNPYGWWITFGKPEPMIKALKKALREEDKKA